MYGRYGRDIFRGYRTSQKISSILVFSDFYHHHIHTVYGDKDPS